MSTFRITKECNDYYVQRRYKFLFWYIWFYVKETIWYGEATSKVRKQFTLQYAEEYIEGFRKCVKEVIKVITV